jgi:polyisoprenyl-phosphate glycosyltransferase
MKEVATGGRRPRPATISVVLPLFNEAAVLIRLADLVRNALRAAGCRYELLFVNDGSTDGSREILDRMAAADPHIHAIHFSRNFGHQAAVQAGLEFARGDAVLVMDSDLQDDPSAIPDLLAQWRAGYDVVYAVRARRKESAWKRILFSGFYRLLAAISEQPIPTDAGNFSLLDRRAVNHVVRLPECDRYFPGLRSWIGFRQTGVPVARCERHDDRPRVSLRGLFLLAKTAIFSFSRLPLTLFYGIAAVSLLACGASATFALYHRLFTGLAIPGWTSITITASFFGAINALGIGILGEYVVRIYDQVRGRPRFIIERHSASAASSEFEDELLADALALTSSAGQALPSEESAASHGHTAPAVSDAAVQQ